jgi:Putative peptidoglycan binding domain/Transglycosylase SLT domain
MLKIGDQGKSVAIMQRKLAAAGYDCIANGSFDSSTQAALLKFQGDQQIKVDGLYGDISRAALDAFLCRKWAAYAASQVANTPLPGVSLTDGGLFAPQYSTFSPATRIQFWAQLIISIMKYESDYDPGNIYLEKFNVYSIGLLQVSYEDQASYHLNLHYSAANHDLEDPQKNMILGIQIMAKLAARDNCISGQVGTNWMGLSAYWSTVRTDPKDVSNYNGIRQRMNALTFP